jgi:hypothetical protein
VDGEVQVKKLREQHVGLTPGRSLRAEGGWGHEESEAQGLLIFLVTVYEWLLHELKITGRSSVTVERGCGN